MMKSKDEILDLLNELTSCAAVSGAEENMISLLQKNLSPYGDVYVDSINNVFCTFGEGKHYLLDAHIDEIGMIVTEITDDGFIKVAKCGGIDSRILLANEVSVWSKKEIYGVVSTIPPHLQKDSDKKRSGY
ncbi:MAG: hypothetical protein LUG95_02610 [Clostridiales bacterium]|nr:hypothetical protein [Clostridiales bacterium]